MPVISGHTSGSILSSRFVYNGRIISYSLVDKSGSGASVTVAIVNAGDQIYIASVVLSGNEMFDQEININVAAGNELLIITSAAIDYYFSLEGT